jgi:putative ABC transport system substrate-binding protein
MKAKILVYALSALILATIQLAEAQQPTKIPRLGYLRQGTPTSAKSEDQAFRHGLRDLGYIEGKNILIEYRYAEGKVERVPDLATELVQLKPISLWLAETVQRELPSKLLTRSR